MFTLPKHALLDTGTELWVILIQCPEPFGWGVGGGKGKKGEALGNEVGWADIDTKLCSSRKYPYSPHGGCFVLHSYTPPGNSSLASYCPSNSLAFKYPLPLGISNDLPRGEYGYLLEPHILDNYH